MKIDILTLFPEAFSYLDCSILKRAQEKKLVEVNLTNIRDFSKDKHKKCDDYPFGGGAGMLMMIQPLYDAIKSVKKRNSTLIFPSPKGKVFDHCDAKELAKKKHLIFICGHYEGVDERLFELFDIKQFSIGDYVLTGGELAAAVIADAVVRIIPGVISDEQSALSDSFQDNLLAPPVYTRPAEYNGWKVPDILLSGHEAKIREWEFQQSLERTKRLRPDLLG